MIIKNKGAIIMRISGIIPAAGLSSRMKDFKPLLALKDSTVIENSINCLLFGGAEEVVVVTGYRGEEIERLISAGYDSRVKTVRNHDYATTDMLHSIKLGCAEINCDAFFLLPGDMPLVSAKTLECIRTNTAAGRNSIVFPTVGGRRKHPPLIGSDFLKDILKYDGADGLRGFWEQMKENIVTVEVSDFGVSVDLDTPQDYAKVCDDIYMRRYGVI